MSATGMVLGGKVLVALVVTSLAAVGGYNLVSTGCPLGTCHAGSGSGEMTPVAQVGDPAAGSDACPLGCTMADKPVAVEEAPKVMEEGCPLCAAGKTAGATPAVELTLASETTEPAADAKPACCEAKGDACPEGGCKGEGSCCQDATGTETTPEPATTAG
ncbi:MAG: hypothetical protein R3B49_09810 [Phycisphaerales bacterium]